MRRDRPTLENEPGDPLWGSDPVAAALRAVGIPYVAMTPGSSFRGLQDSLINFLGNRDPHILLCLHEEHAVAIAHGYAKVTGTPMAAAVHSNVGLMHATMAVFDAFCDRMPMLILGATGPIDAAERRPWIDWIHTSADQGGLVRPYVKWDDQPGSAQAAADAVLRGYAVTLGYPCAPVYICLDAGIQEAPLTGPVTVRDVSRLGAVVPLRPDVAVASGIARQLTEAQRPVILAGRVSRDQTAWDQRVLLAEAFGAVVLTDLKVGAAFPTEHRLHPAPAGNFLTAAAKEVLRQSDLVLSLDWLDLAGTLRQAFGETVTAMVISCTSDHELHNGWSKDHFEQPVVDLAVDTHPDLLVAAMMDALPAEPLVRSGWPETESPRRDSTRAPAGSALSIGELAAALRGALAGTPNCLAQVPLGWYAEDWPFSHPLDYTGHEGGAGVGAGPGIAVGVALALADSGRLAVAVMGDGDYLMSASALWTAAHYELPLLVVVANNRSFFNDEIHQQRVAVRRSRATENRWVGQRLDDPAPDLAGMARSLGLAGYGPVSDRSDLDEVLGRAVADAAAGLAVVVDVVIDSSDYPGLAESAGPTPPTR